MASDQRNIGGGAGTDDSGNNLQSASATYQIAANQVVLLTRKPLDPDPSAEPGPSVITILAAGGLPTFADDGNVDIRGAKGVRITAGPPLFPPTSSDSTNGVEIIVGEKQEITIQRGLLPPTLQTIKMKPEGIIMQSGLSTITLEMDGVFIKSGGTSSIIVNNEGVTIQGPLVQIN
jgi:hypothetical protein